MQGDRRHAVEGQGFAHAEQAHRDSGHEAAQRGAAAHGEHVEAHRLPAQAGIRRGQQEGVRRGVGDAHGSAGRHQQQHQPPQPRHGRGQHHDQGVEAGAAPADAAAVALRRHRQQGAGAEQAAHAERGDGGAELAGAAVKHGLHQYRREGDQRTAQSPRDKDRQQGGGQPRNAHDLAHAGKQAAAGVRFFIPGRGPRGQHPQGDEDERHVGGGAGGIAGHRAEAGHQHASQRRAEDAREVELRGVERKARGDALRGDDRGHDRLERGHGQGVGHADHQRQQDHHPGPDRPAEQQGDHDQRAQHLHRLEQHDDAPAISAVRQHAADQGQQQHRHIHGERVQPDQAGRCADGEQQPGLGDLLRPAADVG